jgi:predicted transcriptional regulator
MENIANTLSAGVGKQAVSDYVTEHDEALTNLNSIDDKIKSFKIKTIKDYIEAYKLKSLLSSLFCYSANNKKAEFDRVADLENNLGNKIAKFARNFKKITPNQRKIGKYILWKRAYVCENRDDIADALIKADMLRKDDKGQYFIIGINLAVGDNTFGFSNRTGKQWRLYNKVCCFMAIGISFYMDKWNETLADKNVPELESYYEKYWVGNYKGGVNITMPWKDKQYIQKLYVNR